VFIGPDAPALDLVITVCGNAEQACPMFPGAPSTAHWGYDDPSAGDASDDIKRVAFGQTLQLLQRRIEALIGLPDNELQPATLQHAARRTP
jgi:hypothetical protein